MPLNLPSLRFFRCPSSGLKLGGQAVMVPLGHCLKIGVIVASRSEWTETIYVVNGVGFGPFRDGELEALIAFAVFVSSEEASACALPFSVVPSGCRGWPFSLRQGQVPSSELPHSRHDQPW